MFRRYLNENDDNHTHIIPDSRTAFIYRPNADFGKRNLKYGTGKYYNDLPEEIKSKLVDSGRNNLL